MEEEVMSNEDLLRVVENKMPGCPDINCKACAENQRILRLLAKRLNVKEYKSWLEIRAEQIRRKNDGSNMEMAAGKNGK